jgi:hypothetical protein
MPEESEERHDDRDERRRLPFAEEALGAGKRRRISMTATGGPA